MFMQHSHVKFWLFFFKIWANPGLFFRLFTVFSKKHYNFYNVKNVHPVYGAGIWTHNLLNMSTFGLTKLDFCKRKAVFFDTFVFWFYSMLASHYKIDVIW